MFFLSGSKGISYVDRGDVAAFDFTLDDFTRDNDYHELDLSGIVGAVTCLVKIRLSLYSGTASRTCIIRTAGNTNTKNVLTYQIIPINVSIDLHGWVMTNSTGKIEYKFSTGTWVNIDTIITGYIK